ncbi:4'-phosphopantetheinyl transferase family protein [Francisella orientalis]|nr:4'-phosphopantetheinyl transferase superfamily protein [Francisella orientalis]AFJ43866.1 Sfp, Phosphopantetheinyl transferase [Francisella orientalis str. Toba 04]AHB99178.1 hypothetical protein M973_05075 [Francisella orientalis LADL 07-285A]APD41270.1 hypothetical protein BMT43_04370 [Francisella orientalis]MBK2005243.1 4'-phosphopantetheinyl transferase superfamily protein [Francisella orientalis]MBK2006585.1 4'-phosphopantetheinyl transferase superfamily protein [Francisella orientalis
MRLSKFIFKLKSFKYADALLLNINDNLDLENMFYIPEIQISEILKYKNDFDRNKRFLARAFLYSYLKSKYYIDDYTIQINRYGKPFLKKNTRIDFSISYSKEYILIAVSDKCKVGVDIEYIDENISHNELKEVIMHDKEIIYYDQLETDIDKLNFFLEVFNIKESIVKSIGVGLYMDIKNICTLDLIKSHKSQETLVLNIFDEIKFDYKTSLKFL